MAVAVAEAAREPARTRPSPTTTARTGTTTTRPGRGCPGGEGRTGDRSRSVGSGGMAGAPFAACWPPGGSARPTRRRPLRATTATTARLINHLRTSCNVRARRRRVGARALITMPCNRTGAGTSRASGRHSCSIEFACTQRSVRTQAAACTSRSRGASTLESAWSTSSVAATPPPSACCSRTATSSGALPRTLANG